MCIILTTTHWRRFFLENLIVAQLAEKFPALNGTGSLITTFKRVPYWNLF